MSDKGWLCVICGHFIQQVLPNQILAKGGRAHTYCVEVQEATEERIIKLLERYQGCRDDELCAYTCSCLRSDRFIELIKEEQK